MKAWEMYPVFAYKANDEANDDASRMSLKPVKVCLILTRKKDGIEALYGVPPEYNKEPLVGVGSERFGRNEQLYVRRIGSTDCTFARYVQGVGDTRGG